MIILEYMLVESRVDDAKAKYPGVDDKIDYLARNDPSGNNKYLMWAVKMVDAGENEREVAYILSDFHDNLHKIQNKDINSYKSLGELEMVIDQAEEEVSKTKQKKEVKTEGIRVIYEDDRWMIVQPLTWEASCIYGRGTRWCISARDQQHHWQNYQQFGVAFAMVFDKTKDNNDPRYKLAISIHPPTIVEDMREQWEDSEEWEREQRLQGINRQFGVETSMEQFEDIVMSGIEVNDATNARLFSWEAEEMLGDQIWHILKSKVAPRDRGMPSQEEMRAAIEQQGMEMPDFAHENLLRNYIREKI